ncbi:hypothetical protein CesoFtcFv8_000245 [Champsocephalus esox]|uniref:Uncharacterized protein n=1 Tax=Champsocephalus esox TaxID=159716 RepID=A0AAN8DXC1_9TELE|nr:hypothetical protein CesoFtcFv8_000245 [Champsocephalus esox]
MQTGSRGVLGARLDLGVYGGRSRCLGSAARGWRASFPVGESLGVRTCHEASSWSVSLVGSWTAWGPWPVQPVSGSGVVGASGPVPSLGLTVAGCGGTGVEGLVAGRLVCSRGGRSLGHSDLVVVGLVLCDCSGSRSIPRPSRAPGGLLEIYHPGSEEATVLTLLQDSPSDTLNYLSISVLSPVTVLPILLVVLGGPSWSY